MKKNLLVVAGCFLAMPIGALLPVDSTMAVQVKEATSQAVETTEANLSSEVIQRLQRFAGNQADAWQQMHAEADKKYQKAIEFQLKFMPPNDLKKLTPDFVLENTRLAYQAIDSANWKEQISEELFFNDVLPYANIDETREDWRTEFHLQFSPLVKDCKTPGEAAQKLNREIFNQVKVHYSTKRRKANQSPSESIEQGMASCTGLSILLVDACRSVGVPARLAGIASWVDKRGNHTWVEVWDGDKWHFTGADEPSDQGLNHAWFEADASKALKDQPVHSIYAVSFRKTDSKFPLVWSRGDDRTVYGVNVTDRYTGKQAAAADETKLRIRVFEAKGKPRVAAKVELSCQQCVGEEPEVGTSKAGRADMNDMLEFAVVTGRTYEIKVSFEGKEVTRELKIQEASPVYDIYLADEE